MFPRLWARKPSKAAAAATVSNLVGAQSATSWVRKPSMAAAAATVSNLL